MSAIGSLMCDESSSRWVISPRMAPSGATRTLPPICTMLVAGCLASARGADHVVLSSAGQDDGWVWVLGCRRERRGGWRKRAAQGVRPAVDGGFAGPPWRPPRGPLRGGRHGWQLLLTDRGSVYLSASLISVGRAGVGDIWRGGCADSGVCQGVLSRMVLRLSSCATSFRICRVIIGVMSFMSPAGWRSRANRTRVL